MAAVSTILSTVTAGDGVTLSVHAYTAIDASRPTILAIHGYPDNHHLWDGVAEQLTGRNGPFNFVAYDVRGAGESSTPADRSGYRLPQLVDDIAAVIDHLGRLGVERVHLLGHDWGSIQGWAAVTDTALMPRIASYTSISGPHLDYAGAFLRSPRGLRAAVDVIKQILASTYIWLFLTPALPEALFRLGPGRGVTDALGRIGGARGGGRPHAAHRSAGDYRNGLNLYRANMPGPFFFPAKPLPQTSVPVQVLVPRKDIFVTPALQRFTGSIPPHSRIVPIDGGHWVVTGSPGVIARHIGEWVNANIAGAVPDDAA